VLVLVLLAVIKQKTAYARLGFIYAVLFLSAGLIQKYRAQDMLQSIALQRGHNVLKMQVKPSFANRHVWKTMYEYEGRYYVDAVKLLWNAEYIPGMSVQKLNIKRDFPWLDKNSQQAKNIERFRWFSDDYLAMSDEQENFIIDVRYSFLPNRIESMWGIILSADKKNNEHVGYKIKSRPDKKTLNKFFDMLF